MGRENRREIVPRALSPPPVQTQRFSFLIIIIIIIIIMIMIMIMIMIIIIINYNNNNKKTYIAPISLLLFSSALKKKQTNKVDELTKKLKQLCQHYGVGSEQAPGEGGVETS